MKVYRPGDKLVLPALIKRSNPEKQLALIQLPNGAECPVPWSFVEAWEVEARSMVYVERDTVPIDTSQQAG